MTNNIVACIDGSVLSAPVCDAGSWASRQLAAPLVLLHVLKKPESPATSDLSGSIGLGSREHLLEELVSLDEKRGKLAREHGKGLLSDASVRAQQQGAVEVSTLQRHGYLIETLLDLEAETRLLVIGRQGKTHEHAAQTVGTHMENVIRTIARPILVTVGEFTAPQRFMIAYDGSPTAQKAVEMVARSPLLTGLPCHLVMVSDKAAEHQPQLDSACEKLTAAGFKVTASMVEGEPPEALHRYQQEHQMELIVMGAYGHSRIRQFFVGSNTTKMVSRSTCPLLLLR